MTNDLTKLAAEVHKNAASKGFWDRPSEFGTLLMLIVSELGECLESDRINKRAATHEYFALPQFKSQQEFEEAFRTMMKDTVEDELADAIIRILDVAAAYSIDIGYHVEQKMLYNATRPPKHGKEY